MSREHKGSPHCTHADNYCVVDLETTGIFVSAAKIIEISAIKVRDNQVSDEFSTLVNPHCHIPAEATAVNHITDEMVIGAPDLPEVLAAFLEFVGDDVIVGYNNAGFDMNIIYDACIDLFGKPFTNDYFDVLHAARRCLAGIMNYKLETVSKYYGIDTAGEHRALVDCYLTKAVYDRLHEEYGSRMLPGGSHRKKAFAKSDAKGGKRFEVRYSAETLALQELQGLLKGIIADGEITEGEFSALKAWMEKHRDLQGNYPFDRVFLALDKVLEDGVVTSGELDELQVLFSGFVDPVKCRGCRDEIKSVHGKHIVVTGDFEYGGRKEVCALIERAGGIIDNSVKRATEYVVVGAKGSEYWKTGNYGSKIQKAMELKDKGVPIEIVEESVFIPAVLCILEESE